jgi:hypothetical protein
MRSRQRDELIGPHAALGGLAIDVDLQADLQGRQPARPLLGQALRDLQPIHRMHPVKLLGHHAGLVGLQRPDQMPLGARHEVGQGRDLLEGLLHIVLAKAALTRGVHRAHRGFREGLADSQQRDRAHRSSGLYTGRFDPLPLALSIIPCSPSGLPLKHRPVWSINR